LIMEILLLSSHQLAVDKSTIITIHILLSKIFLVTIVRQKMMKVKVDLSILKTGCKVAYLNCLVPPQFPSYLNF